MVQAFKVYQGFHSADLYELLKSSWVNDHAVIICPPHLKPPDASTVEIPEDTILGVYTSGTLSGKPRLIFYTKANILASLDSIRSLFQKEEIKKIFCYPQATHTFGLTLGYIQSIVYQIPIQFNDGPYSTGSHKKWVEAWDAGLLTLGTPTHFIDLLTYVKKNNISPQKTYSAIVGGAPVTRKLWRQLRDELNIEAPSIGYGATEASPGIAHLAPGMEPICDGDIGNILAGVQMLEHTEEGYFFSGKNLCNGIFEEGRPSKPNRVFIKDQLIKNESGRYIFNGRSDLIINRGGLKLSPELMESSIFSTLGLKAACISIYSERLTEDLAILVQTDRTLNENEKQGLISDVSSVLKDSFLVSIADENILLHDIPLNSNAKYDRIECAKLILNQKKLKLPIKVDYLKPFLPHRATAIWIDRIVQFEKKIAVAEVDLEITRNIFTNGQLRSSACIELVAQTYGYGKASYEISVLHEPGATSIKATKTLIAEVRQAEFFFSDQTDALVEDAITKKIPLRVEAECTHDFGLIKVIRGQVKLGKTVLGRLSLKAFVSPE